VYQIYFILEWHSTCFRRSFHPSSGVQDCTYSNQILLSACLQVQAESGICLTDACCCMYSLELLMMDGKTVRNMWSVIPKSNKFDTLVHLVGFTVDMSVLVFASWSSASSCRYVDQRFCYIWNHEVESICFLLSFVSLNMPLLVRCSWCVACCMVYVLII